MATEEITKKDSAADSEIIAVNNEKRIGCAHYKRRAKFVVSSKVSSILIRYI